MAAKPTIVYFPIRGRAEMHRIALSLAGVDFDEKVIDTQEKRDEMKENRDLYQFGQCPAFIDGDLNLTQSNTIMRYIGRKYNLMGSNEKEITAIDMVMEGVESIRQKYAMLIYMQQCTDEAKAAFYETHCKKSTSTGKNGGAHVEFLARMLRASPTGWVAGTANANLADICLWEMFDLLHRLWPNEVAAEYPELMAHHAKFAGVPNVKAYLDGPKRLAKVNNSVHG